MLLADAPCFQYNDHIDFYDNRLKKEADIALDLLLEEAQGMSEASLMEVVRFMRFVKMENNGNPEEPVSHYAEGSSNVIRKPGLYKGLIKMADDFDAPLEDFKEYM